MNAPNTRNVAELAKMLAEYYVDESAIVFLSSEEIDNDAGESRFFINICDVDEEKVPELDDFLYDMVDDLSSGIDLPIYINIVSADALGAASDHNGARREHGVVKYLASITSMARPAMQCRMAGENVRLTFKQRDQRGPFTKVMNFKRLSLGPIPGIVAKTADRSVVVDCTVDSLRRLEKLLGTPAPLSWRAPSAEARFSEQSARQFTPVEIDIPRGDRAARHACATYRLKRKIHPAPAAGQRRNAPAWAS